MNKTLLFILLSSVSFSISAAEYVSPTEYKDFSCEELKEDYKGVFTAKLDTMVEQDKYNFRSRKYQELNENYEKLDARLDAIEKAAKKINCDLKSSSSSDSPSN